jgi:hypothetical protein
MWPETHRIHSRFMRASRQSDRFVARGMTVERFCAKLKTSLRIFFGATSQAFAMRFAHGCEHKGRMFRDYCVQDSLTVGISKMGILGAFNDHNDQRAMRCARGNLGRLQ